MKKRKLLFSPWSGNNKNYAAYQSWYSPLKKIFDEIIIFDPQENLYQYGQDEMNKRFLEVVRKEKPDYIFFLLIYEEFYIDTLLKIKEISPKTRTINFFGDDDTLFNNYSRFYSLIIDYHLVSQIENLYKYKKDNIIRVFPSFAVNTERFYPIKTNKIYDVTFIGTPKEDRYKVLKFLKNSGINIKIFGPGWGKYKDLIELYGGILDYSSLVKTINQSKININFTKNIFGAPHFKARVFEVGACNAFLITENFSGYSRFLKNNKELIMFKDQNDLLKKIKYYLENDEERENIAESAYKKIIKNYSQHIEFKKIFKHIFKDENKKINWELPKLNKKIIEISRKDLEKSSEELKNIVEEGDYICFREQGARNSKYKNYFQAYSLEKSKKSISCCDYNVYSKLLGDYLGISAERSFNFLNKKDFGQIVSISQLMINKDYLIKNLENIKNFLNLKNEEFITKDNTCFVSIPLTRIIKNIKIDNKKPEQFCFYKFENNLRAYHYKNKLLTNTYFYKLLFRSILKERFILSHILKRIKELGASKILSKNHNPVSS